MKNSVEMYDDPKPQEGNYFSFVMRILSKFENRYLYESAHA